MSHDEALDIGTSTKLLELGKFASEDLFARYTQLINSINTKTLKTVDFAVLACSMTDLKKSATSANNVLCSIDFLELCITNPIWEKYLSLLKKCYLLLMRLFEIQCTIYQRLDDEANEKKYPFFSYQSDLEKLQEAYDKTTHELNVLNDARPYLKAVNKKSLPDNSSQGLLKNCNNCSSSIPDDSDFCPFCGTRSKTVIEPQVAPVAQAQPVSAQATAPAYKQYAPPTQQQAAAPLYGPHNPAPQQPQQVKSKKFCKCCGGAVDDDTKKCNKCGKQYFKVTYSTIVIALLCLVLGVSVAYNANLNDALAVYKENLYMLDDNLVCHTYDCLYFDKNCDYIPLCWYDLENYNLTLCSRCLPQ